jgi:hypothetical protein
MGVPLSQWSHGTGLLFAAGTLALVGSVPIEASAIIVGWLATLVFWWAMLKLLLYAAKNDPLLAFFGAGATFLGTHAGFYSHAIATETMTYALSAVLALLVIKPPQKWRARDIFLAGTAAGLLIAIRSLLVIYALPALAVTGLHINRAGKNKSATQKALSFSLLLLPVAVALLQIALTNRWMTGSFAHSPYAFGSESFHSFDWTRPLFLTVVSHPWHGWLSYHPLYAIGFAALIVLFTWEPTRAARLAYVTIGVVVLTNLYVQAAWYSWWLGAAFGLRGMSVTAVVLMPLLIRVISASRDRSPIASRIWIMLAIGACLWSYLLLLRGKSSFYTYEDLLLAQRLALPPLLDSLMLLSLGTAAAITISFVYGILSSRQQASTGLFVRWAAILLGTLVDSYLLSRLFQYPFAHILGFSMLAIAIAAAAYVVQRGSQRGTWKGMHLGGWVASVAAWGMIGIYAIMLILFANLALRTEQHIARNTPPSRTFAYTSSIALEEVRYTYLEYQHVPGFDDRKAALREFLSAEGVALD